MATTLTPADPGYDEAREIFNRALDRRPARIVRCASTADVVAGLRAAREDGLAVAVRAGGHNFSGHAQPEGGVVLDLRGLIGVVVDPAAGRVVAGAGLRWREYDEATQAYGLATPGGSISTVGVAGFTLGTGLGWLGRRWGLAHDNLLAAELVTADGDVRLVDDGSDPDLMWALRGGCGNFGVVTALHLAARELTGVVAGVLAVGIDRAAAVLTALAADPTLTQELSWTGVVIVPPPGAPLPGAGTGRPVLLVTVMADDAPGLAALDRLRRAAPQLDGDVSPLPWLRFQRLAEASAPWGMCWDVRSEWLGHTSTDGIEAVVAAAADMASPLSEVILRPMGGFVSERPDDATAFGFRHADWLIEVIAGWAPGEDPAPHRDWMTRTWRAAVPFSCGGADVNHLGVDEPAARTRSAWSPAGYARLQEVKRRVDPDEVFTATGSSSAEQRRGGPGPPARRAGPRSGDADEAYSVTR